MKKSIKYIFIFCSTVVFSQNTTVLYDIKKKCEEVSLVGVVDKKYYRNNVLLLNNNSMQGKFIVKTIEKFPLPIFLCLQ